jgi:hypothetical protein
MGKWMYRCIDPHFLHLCTSLRWVVSFMPWPLYPRYPLYRRLGGPQSRSGRHGELKILDPTRTRTPITLLPSPFCNSFYLSAQSTLLVFTLLLLMVWFFCSFQYFRITGLKFLTLIEEIEASRAICGNVSFLKSSLVTVKMIREAIKCYDIVLLLMSLSGVRIRIRHPILLKVL